MVMSMLGCHSRKVPTVVYALYNFPLVNESLTSVDVSKLLQINFFVVTNRSCHVF